MFGVVSSTAPSRGQRHPLLAQVLIIATLAAVSALAAPSELTLAAKGQAQCVIVVPEGAMAVNVVFPRAHTDYLERIAEVRRQLQRESVRDLALYLGKMTGAEFEIVTTQPAGDKRLPILVGKPAEEVFGPVGISKAEAFGFRVVSDPRRGLGLYGESEHGTSYAIYELLHRLGCRWFMPTELGEVVPDRPTLTAPVMDEKFAPATETRGMSQGGADWQRRNRFTTGGGLGRIPGTPNPSSPYENRITYDGVGVTVSAGHNGVYRLIPLEKRRGNPEWRMLLDGERSWMVRWTHPEVAEVIADTICREIETHFIGVLKAGYPLCYDFSMFDMRFPTEDPYERQHDPDPRVWEPASGQWSVTDRYILLANRVIERVAQRYPNVRLGLLGYVNHSMPPARYKPHPSIIWTIAPIDFNPHHPMTWENHPNEHWLRDMVEDWAELGVRLGAYWYGINHGEISAPCPFIAKWGLDLSILMANNLVYWNPETMNGWDSMMPGYYLGARLTFDPTEKPDAILADMWTRFYGAAAEPMSRYWTGIDRAYLEAHEYGGSPFSYLRIFTPEVMAAARTNLNEALALCRTPLEYRRVKLIDESFSLFELFMNLRRNWAAGNLRNLDTDYETWRAGVLDMVRRYRDPSDPTYVQGRHTNPRWSDEILRPGYADASRMEREYVRHGAGRQPQAMVEWKWKYNPGPEADALPWTTPDCDDRDWPITHVVRDTWSTLGHHDTLTDEPSGRSGRMAYRTTQRLPALPEGKRAYLWIGAADGRVKLFVNGRHVKYVVPEKTRTHEAGERVDLFDGSFQPARFDVTDALHTGDNQITILAERYQKRGTGGLMGPVVFYREK